MKKHNTSKVVLITLLVFLVLSWILPAAYYSGQYVEQGRVQMGLFDLFNYPLTALSYFGYIALYIILVGGFYGILYKIPAYRVLLDKIVDTFKEKEKYVLLVMIVVISALVSICGLHIGIALFIPFVVSIILLMGYDKIVAAMVTVGSISAGLIGTTYAYNNISVLLQALSLKYDYQILVRFVILLVAIVLVFFNTLMYIKQSMKSVKVEKKTVKKAEDKEEKMEEKIEKKVVSSAAKNNKKSSNKQTSKSNSNKSKTSKNSKSSKNPNKAALTDEDIIVVKETLDDENELVPSTVKASKKVLPLVIVLSLLFLVFVLAFIPWGENVFKVKFFTDLTNNTKNFKLFGFPLFTKLLGNFNEFGAWTITDMFLPMFLSVGLLLVVYKVSFEEAFDGFVKGAKKALAPAGIAILIYTALVLVTYHPFQTVLYKSVLGLTKGFNIITTVIVALLASIFNADVAYTFQAVVPYYSSVVTNVENYSLPAIILQSIYGLTALVAPTSLGLMATLSYLKVSDVDWLKNSWKLLLELFVVLLIVFIILSI